MTCDNILEAVGKTPLVRLNRIPSPKGAKVYGKAEQMNPGGSVKDRIGIQMVLAAEKAGLLKPGGTIVEPTAGNTGIGLALVAAVKGYNAIFVVPDKMAQEKIDLLRAYGAKVEVVPNVGVNEPDSYMNVAKRLAHEIPGAFMPNQFANQENQEAHYLTTGPEIWEQTGGKIDAFVAGIGTGGTVTGVSRYLREQKPDIQIIGADPEGSIYGGGYPGSYFVEGIGMSYLPKSFDHRIVDRYLNVSDKESFIMARRLTREEGLMVGGSAGTAAHAACKIAEEMSPDQTVVFILCDTGRNYLSKIYNDAWMMDNGFLKEDTPRATLRDALKAKANPAELFTLTPDTPVLKVVELMDEHDISQFPVMDGDQPVGSLQDSAVMQALYKDPSLSNQPVSKIMARPMPFMGLDTDLDDVYLELSAGRPGVLVKDENGKLSGIVTRTDVIDFLASKVKGK